MRIASICPALLTLLFLTAFAHAGDANEIKRPPIKEPVYQSKHVEYWLLVFGPDAKTRVWVVRDGDTWYFDRNGNGDLTEEGKQITGKDGYFAEPVQIRAGQTNYKITHFNDHSTNYYIAVETEGKHQQYASSKSARTPKDARMVHFDGPLVMGLRFTDPAKVSVERRSKPSDLFVLVATGDPARDDPWGPVINNRELVPADVHPVADFEFAPRKAGGDPIKLRVMLTERC
jgi:hypothetical protein